MDDRRKPYVSGALRRAQAQWLSARLKEKGQALTPAAGGKGPIARTFWGKAWCDNLERYSDFANRLPRGRTYFRNGSVIDLKIAAGEVAAQVTGSRLYKVAVNVAAVPSRRWQMIGKDCVGSIDSLVELLRGDLSARVMERICRPRTGLFPSPGESAFSCSCPDWAAMCKHVAAVFYGIGARLDEEPELLFRLRRVDARDLIARAGAGMPLATREPAAGRVLDAALVADVFGIEMAQAVAPASRKQRVARTKSARVRKDSVNAAARKRGRK